MEEKEVNYVGIPAGLFKAVYETLNSLPANQSRMLLNSLDNNAFPVEKKEETEE